MATTRRLHDAAPRPSEMYFGHGFLVRFAVVSVVTVLVLLLTTVLAAGPLPHWTGVIAAIGVISLLVGVLAGLFGERFVDWWLKLIRFFAHP